MYQNGVWPSTRRRQLNGSSSTITTEELQSLFHLSIDMAALQLQVGVTTLKKMCRTQGIKRWPFRRVQQIVRIGKLTTAGLTSLRDYKYVLEVLLELDLWLESPLWANVDADAAEGMRSILRGCGAIVQAARDGSPDDAALASLPPFMAAALSGAFEAAACTAAPPTAALATDGHTPACTRVSPGPGPSSPQQQQTDWDDSDGGSGGSGNERGRGHGHGSPRGSGGGGSSADVSNAEIWRLVSAAAEKLLPPSLGGTHPPRAMRPGPRVMLPPRDARLPLSQQQQQHGPSLFHGYAAPQLTMHNQQQQHHNHLGTRTSSASVGSDGSGAAALAGGGAAAPIGNGSAGSLLDTLGSAAASSDIAAQLLSLASVRSGGFHQHANGHGNGGTALSPQQQRTRAQAGFPAPHATSPTPAAMTATGNGCDGGVGSSADSQIQFGAVNALLQALLGRPQTPQGVSGASVAAAAAATHVAETNGSSTAGGGGSDSEALVALLTDVVARTQSAPPAPQQLQLEDRQAIASENPQLEAVVQALSAAIAGAGSAPPPAPAQQPHHAGAVGSPPPRAHHRPAAAPPAPEIGAAQQQQALMPDQQEQQRGSQNQTDVVISIARLLGFLDGN